MVTESIETVDALNASLQKNKGWANGKNFPVDHLHATVAESRWEYENIYGIYLTNEVHMWMGLWMAVSNRNTLRKRNISYRRPRQADDAIGSIELYSDLPPSHNLCENAYLYIFNPSIFNGTPAIDITKVPKEHKVEALLFQGFERQAVVRRGRAQPAVVDVTGVPRVVLVDDWQVALTNTPDIFPSMELAIQKSAIAELAGRVSLINSEIGEDYLR